MGKIALQTEAVQLKFACLDLELHTKYVPGGSETIYDVDKRVSKRTQVIAPLAEDRFLCSFSIYLQWAEVLSADAFSAFEDAGLNDEKELILTDEIEELNRKVSLNESSTGEDSNVHIHLPVKPQPEQQSHEEPARATSSSALNNLIVTSEEVILFLPIFCERLQVQAQSFCFLEGTSKEEVSRIRSYLQDAISYWIRIINQTVHGDSSTIQLQETKLALLWGIISCYPYMTDIQTNSSLLLDFVGAIDQLLVIECESLSLQKVPIVRESLSRQIVPLFLKFMGYNIYDDFSAGSFNTQACKGKDWKNVLQEWLTLLKVMRNPKSNS
ncbi:uncharacterized protein LOC130782135 [Actinidia eriantha]|uniref:uncharacterized protein LOC130782135 n=1 Tax=Actinidia eriantha TaxID=165200 RepID=UPI002586FFAA|nr:uncharacterized protein LOC130782135 [Actinidia eriantha]